MCAADQDSIRFCKHCGASSDPSASVTERDDDTLILRLLEERPEEALDRRARLWLLDPAGEHIAQVSELTEEMTVFGRQPDCSIGLPSSTVSRHHAQIRREGGNPFTEYQLPEAVLRFKQGFGRLIRSREDRGIVVILDGRVVQQWYGRRFLEALPNCEIVIAEQEQ